MADVLTRLGALEEDSGPGGPTTDADSDGFLGIADGGSDCNDADASVRPGAPEVVGDGIDQDCDGADAPAPDCDDGNAATTDTWDASTQTCTSTLDSGLLVPYYTGPANTDGIGVCQSGLWDGVSVVVQPDVTPTPEVRGDFLDNDCDGMEDEESWFQDLDNDGYGTATVIESPVGGPGFALVSGDCDDSNQHVYPGAVEDSHNGIDDDCDGAVDELP
ncbi:MAG: putative metal-binding motif-containing protein, partial [Gaiellaceae bacterium]